MRIQAKPCVSALTLATVVGLNLGGLPGEALGQDRIILRGLVRDFRAEHPDFGVAPPEGFGHAPGNASLTLVDGRQLLFTGQGYMAISQWRDVQGRSIAPHLYNKAGLNYWTWSEAGVAVNGAISMDQNTTIDSWDSEAGTYDDTMASDAVVATNADETQISINATATLGGDLMVGPDGDPAAATSSGSVEGLAGVLDSIGDLPTVTVPTNLGPSTGDWSIGSFTTATISTWKLHVDNFTVDQFSTVYIDGNVIIRVDQSFNLARGVKIELTPGSTLVLYTLGTFNAYNQDVTINANTMDPSLVTIYQLGTTPIEFSQNAQIYANIVAPNADLILNSDADLYGSFIGQSITLDSDAGMHIDTSPNLATACGPLVIDSAGIAGADTFAGVTDAYTFWQWFHDVPGVNAGKKLSINLTLAPDGMYEYDTDAFYPIDGKLYGNEGAAHNYHFTLEIPMSFVYEACAGQVFEFEGNDDVWLYIDGKLVMDLGGMLANVPQVVEMDRLGLTDGQSYDIRFFYAQRQSISARFRIRTNITLVPQPYNQGLVGFADFD
ncbi:MAG: fibro-slime domain-containing protein [Planctomycetes bacterium]|nr:fibro-slime domain-containing protein [Planctomycetota bacterium]